MGFATLFGVCSSTSYWDQLSVSDREDLEALAIRDVLPAGETVIRQRGRSYSVLIILQGHVVVISEARSSAKMPADAAALAEAPDVFLAWRGRGDIIGEMSAIRKVPRSATVRAVEEIEVLEIDGTDFVNYLRNHFEAHLALDVVQAERLAEAAAVRRAERRKVPARVAQVLTEAADRVGKQSREGLWLQYPRTQTDLAELIGASRESVSAALGQLRRDGIVATRPTRLIISDLDALRKVADSTVLYVEYFTLQGVWDNINLWSIQPYLMTLHSGRFPLPAPRASRARSWSLTCVVGARSCTTWARILNLPPG
jgi:CRP/FNR family cyclic AMP-dependent transcriptional regulator